jgi:hypothetical protein
MGELSAAAWSVTQTKVAAHTHTHTHTHTYIYIHTHTISYLGVRGDAMIGNALHVGKSWFRSPMVSMGF